MLKFLTLAAATAAVIASPAAAQPSGPTPGEQVGIHTGSTTTNGSSTIVTDRNGTHPDGFTGQLPVNRVSASRGMKTHHHHHRHHARLAAPAQPPT